MTQAPVSPALLPGTDAFNTLLDEIRSGAKDRDLNDENPFEQVIALKQAGFGTLRLPAEFGGPGLSVPQLFSAIIDVASADPIVAHIFRTHFWFVEERLRALRANPSDAVSRHWLHEVAAGKLFANAFSEKGSLAVGSLVFNTRLLPDSSGGYRLNGEKFYSTGTLFSDYLTVATTSDHDSVASVIVPADREDVRLIDDWDGFGQRRTGTGTTVFTDVAVSADEVLGDTPYDAEPEPTVQYASLQLFIHAVVAGVLQSVVDDGAALLRSRTRSFSHALTESPVDDPLYQKLLGELASSERAANEKPQTQAAPKMSFDKIGLAVSELSREQRADSGLSSGLLVEKASGLAAKAGLSAGDVILAVNHSPVSELKTFAGLLQGDAVALLVRRGDSTLFLPLRLRE